MTQHFFSQVKIDVGYRETASFEHMVQPPDGIGEGCVVECCERVMVDSVWFTRLVDGRGWLFEEKGELIVLQRLWISRTQFNALQSASASIS